MKRILGLINLIYDAAADEARRSAFLAELARTLQARAVLVVLWDAERAAGRHVRSHGWSDDDVRLYLDQYADEDGWLSSAAHSPEGTVAADDVANAGRAYREFYAPRGCDYGIHGVIVATGKRLLAIHIVRGSAAGPFHARELTILQALLPHLRKAAEWEAELAIAWMRTDLLSGHLDRYAHALVLVDRDRQVLYASAAALVLTARRDGVRIESGMLKLRSPQLDQEFSRATRELPLGRHGAIKRWEIPRPSGKPPLRMILLPDHSYEPRLTKVRPVAVLLHDAESHWQPDAAILRELFSFTQAEARVVAKLVVGLSLEEVAAALHLSIETVRTHVKRAMAKTSTSRQGELVSLILRAMPLIG